MLQHVLPVRGAELEPSEQPDHLRVQIGDPDVDHRLLPGPLDPLLDLLLRALEGLLDPRGVDAPVLHELLEGEPGGLAADRVEAREHHRLRRVVDDEVHAGGRLEGSDVPTLATDDPPLHVLTRQREDAHRGLARLLRRDTLDRDRHDLPGALLALLAGALLDLAYGRHRLALRLIDDLPTERLAGLLSRHLCDPLERRPMLGRRLLELLAHEPQPLVTVVQLLGSFVRLVELDIDRALLLRQTLLLALDLLPPGPQLHLP